MSDHLSIAVVSAALGQTLQGAANEGVPGAQLRLGRPDGQGGNDNKATVNLFLYQVTPNKALRNAHLPTRGGDGRLVQRPQVALDLHYLVSFYGNEASFEPERMLAAVARTMEATPIVTRAQIKAVIQQNNAVLGGADLGQAPETVKATPVAMTLDELSKLWSVFFQVPYALSAAYMLSYVIIETDDTPRPPLPATRPRNWTGPFARVGIHAVESDAGASAPIVWGGGLVLRGRGLGREGLSLEIDGAAVAMSQAETGAERIALPLQPASFGGAELAAGLHRVQPVLPPPPNAPAHLAWRGDSAAFALRSRLALPANAVSLDNPGGNDPANGALKVDFTPKVRKGQQVRLLLDERVADAPKSYVLTPEPVADADFPATRLTFKFAGVKRSTYLMRAQVDGVESAPEVETDSASPNFGEITGPTVQIP